MMTTPNLGPDAPTATNAEGGRESVVSGRLDLLPPLAILRIGEILETGATKYGVNNWRKIESWSHLNHALIHGFAALTGGTQDDHAGHFACRALMYLEQVLKESAS